MGKRGNHKGLGRLLTKELQSGAAAAGASGGAADDHLSISEMLARGRARRRESEYVRGGGGGGGDGGGPGADVVRGSTLLGLEWRLKELRQDFHGGHVPPSWIDAGQQKVRRREQFVRDPFTQRWYERGASAAAIGAEAAAARTLLGGHNAVPSLRSLAADAFGGVLAQLNATDLHEFVRALPTSLKVQVVSAIVNGTEEGEAVPDEAVRLLRSFPFESLDLGFRTLSIFALLKGREPTFGCAAAPRRTESRPTHRQARQGSRDSVHRAEDEPADSWEDDVVGTEDAAWAGGVGGGWRAMPCSLHGFQLHRLDTLNLSFATLVGVNGPDMVGLMSEVLPQLRALFLAGCLHGSVHGPDTIAAIATLLPTLTVLDLAHNMLLAPIDLEFLSHLDALPLLHTLFIHDCPLIKHSVVESWRRLRKPSLLTVHSR